MPLLTLPAADGVLELRLDRPAKLNAIDAATARELLVALRKAHRDDAVRAVLLAGNGRAFCAGRDVSEPPNPAILQLVQAVSMAMVECSKPIVVAVHGWAVGAGVEWMLDCDIAIAARSTRLRLPEIQLGVFVTGGVSATLPSAAGLARAKGALLLGEEFSAQEAERWGLVWKVVDDEALDAEARRAAARLAGFDPRVVSRFKRVLNTVGLPALQKTIDLESAMHGELGHAGPPAAVQSIGKPT